MKAPRALRMFGEESLPLFSGTAPRGKVDVFVPAVIPDMIQLGLSPSDDEPEEVFNGDRGPD
jgi:hypothetical protein